MQSSSDDADILLIDKPKGITSFDVIRILRKKLSIRKMGHAGTLDPLASGLMIVGVGDGTKKLANLIKLPKVYQAEILLGKKTETGDLEGKIVEELGPLELEKFAAGFSEEKIKKLLSEMTGSLHLPVPFYSAIKVRGQRLYAIARKNKRKTETEIPVLPPELPIKEMRIFWITFIESDIKSGRIDAEKYPEVNYPVNYPVVSIQLEVASGTYIRSIAEEIGKRLGVPATLKNLRRIKIGEFTIEKAESL